MHVTHHHHPHACMSHTTNTFMLYTTTSHHHHRHLTQQVQAIMLAPEIKKLPVSEGEKFYSPEARRGQLKEVEQHGFVRDAWYCQQNCHVGLYVDPVTGERLCRDLWALQLRGHCIISCHRYVYACHTPTPPAHERECMSDTTTTRMHACRTSPHPHACMHVAHYQIHSTHEIYF